MGNTSEKQLRITATYSDNSGKDTAFLSNSAEAIVSVLNRIQTALRQDDQHEPVMIERLQIAADSGYVPTEATANITRSILSSHFQQCELVKPFLVRELILVNADVTLQQRIGAFLAAINAFPLNTHNLPVILDGLRVRKAMRVPESLTKIIHISGFPGVGKTTLAADISARCAIEGKRACFHETDLFIQHHLTTGKMLLAIDALTNGINDEILYQAAFEHILDYSIQNAMNVAVSQGNTSLVLTGLLDNFAADGFMPYTLPVPHIGIWLSLDMARALKQYYQREVIQNKDDDTYWTKLAKKELYVLGSFHYIDNTKKLHDWHVSQGYQVVDRDTAAAHVIGILF